MSVAGYFTKMKGLWDELASYNDSPTCSCGAIKKHHEKEERNALMQFLMGLNESYSAVRGQILLMNPLPSLRRAYALVSQEEKQRELGSARVVAESAAMVVRSSQQQQRANNNQRPNISQQHQQSRPNQLLHNSSFSQQSLLCSHCGDTNHVVETCWKLHGYPSWHRLHKSGGGNHNSKGGGGRNKSSSANHVDANPSFYDVKAVMPNLTNQQYKQICSVLKEKESDSQPDSQANIAGSSLFKNCSTTLNWIIDSGATDHITSSPHLLTNVKHSTMPPVKLPSGDQAPITATGTLPINSYLFLKDVLGVPTFKVDLMSVSKITEDLTCSVTFFPQWCVLLDLATRRTIGLGKRRGGLYYLGLVWECFWSSEKCF
ncbi:unnamed protein product [Prunus armeniaca]